MTAPAGTDVSRGRFIADTDTATTAVLNPDTDGGGVSDGAEDVNRNGSVDLMELNPSIPPMTRACPPTRTGTASPTPRRSRSAPIPNDADSDDDGLLDGQSLASPTTSTATGSSTLWIRIQTTTACSTGRRRGW